MNKKSFKFLLSLLLTLTSCRPTVKTNLVEFKHKEEVNIHLDKYKKYKNWKNSRALGDTFVMYMIYILKNPGLSSVDVLIGTLDNVFRHLEVGHGKELVYQISGAFRDLIVVKNRQLSTGLISKINESLRRNNKKVWDHHKSTFYPEVLIHNLIHNQKAVEYLEAEKFSDEYSQLNQVLLRCSAYLKMGNVKKAINICSGDYSKYKKTLSYYRVKIMLIRAYNQAGMPKKALEVNAEIPLGNKLVYKSLYPVVLIEKNKSLLLSGKINKSNILLKNYYKSDLADNNSGFKRWLCGSYARALFSFGFYKKAKAIIKLIPKENKFLPPVSGIVKNNLFDIILAYKHNEDITDKMKKLRADIKSLGGTVHAIMVSLAYNKIIGNQEVAMKELISFKDILGEHHPDYKYLKQFVLD